jgi:ABC-type bacteriocin/lantibiotic exporter with double-glycine peptidase domain
MSEATKIRQALGVNLATVKIALVFVVMWAGLYLWKHTALHLWMLCLWSAISIVGLLVYRARKRKLQALDSD